MLSIRFYVSFLFLALAFQIAGQDWNQLDMVVRFKPEFRLKDHKTVLIPDVKDSQNRTNENCLKVFASVTNAISAIGDVKIASRDVTELIWKEVERMESGDVNKSYRVDPRSNMISSGILFVVRLMELSYNEKTDRRSTFNLNNCDHYNQRIGTSRITIQVKIVDIKTTEVLFSKNINAQKTKRSSKCSCCNPAKLDESDITSSCLEELEKEIKRTFDSYNARVSIAFQKDKLFNDALKTALANFKIEEYQTGFDLLEQIAGQQTKPKSQSGALYNLALAQTYFYHFNPAYENAKKAYVLNPDNEDCLILIDRIKELNVITE
jgi:hypothetical protein